MPATDPIKAKAFSKEHLLTCKGYDPSFISSTANIHLDILSATDQKNLPEVEGNTKGVLHYSRYSVCFHKKRRVPFFTASNIDGSKKKDGIKRPSGFKPDPRVDAKYQLNDNFYDLEKDFTEFEIGHMASNDELSWGATLDDAKLYSYESFHFTNSVPQAERLNSGLWRSLEQYILDEIPSTDTKRIAVFSGPVIDSKDPLYVKDETFKVPLLFWKVIVFRYKKKLKATAFVMSHEKKLRELDMLIEKPAIKGITKKKAAEAVLPFEDYPHKTVFQVSVELVEQLTGYSFKWQKVNRIAIPDDANRLKKLRTVGSATDIPKKKGIKKAARKKTALNMILE